MLYKHLEKHFDDEPWGWYTWVIFAIVYVYENIRYRKSFQITCDHCKKGKLKVIQGNYPYTINHFQCPKCDSTYNISSEMRVCRNR